MRIERELIPNSWVEQYWNLFQKISFLLHDLQDHHRCTQPLIVLSWKPNGFSRNFRPIYFAALLYSCVYTKTTKQLWFFHGIHANTFTFFHNKQDSISNRFIKEQLRGYWKIGAHSTSFFPVCLIIYMDYGAYGCALKIDQEI